MKSRNGGVCEDSAFPLSAHPVLVDGLCADDGKGTNSMNWKLQQEVALWKAAGLVGKDAESLFEVALQCEETGNSDLAEAFLEEAAFVNGGGL